MSRRGGASSIGAPPRQPLRSRTSLLDREVAFAFGGSVRRGDLNWPGFGAGGNDRADERTFHRERGLYTTERHARSGQDVITPDFHGLADCAARGREVHDLRRARLRRDRIAHDKIAGVVAVTTRRPVVAASVGNPQVQGFGSCRNKKDLDITGAVSRKPVADKEQLLRKGRERGEVSADRVVIE